MCECGSLLHECRSDRPRGAVPLKSLVLIAVCLLLVIMSGYWAFSSSTEDLLNLKTLTPQQIRAVATKLLLNDDIKIRVRAGEKLASLG